MLDPLPCKDGSTWTPDWRYEQFLRQRFLNLGPEWQRMLLWLLSHDGKDGSPDRRKTRRGMKAFVGGWLAKSGVLRPSSTCIQETTAQPVDKMNGRTWIKAIRAQLQGREPGADEAER